MTNARGLTEAALLTGLSVVLYLGANFIPVLGIGLIFLSPVPLVILEMRHDLKMGFVSLIVGSLLAMLVSGPVSALSYAFGFALMALALGRIIELKTNAIEIIGWGSLVSLACKLALAVIMFYVTGINPMNLDMPSVQKALDWVGTLPGISITPEVRAQFEQMFRMVPLIVPAIFIMAAVMDCMICYWVSGKVIKRLNHIELPKLPPFTHWRFPASVLWAFAACIICSLLGQYYPQLAILTRAALNVTLLVQYLFVMQGLSFIAWWLESKGITGFGRNMILVLAFFMPLLSQMTTYTGMFDMCFNFRERIGRRR